MSQYASGQYSDIIMIISRQCHDMYHDNVTIQSNDTKPNNNYITTMSRYVSRQCHGMYYDNVTIQSNDTKPNNKLTKGV